MLYMHDYFLVEGRRIFSSDHCFVDFSISFASYSKFICHSPFSQSQFSRNVIMCRFIVVAIFIAICTQTILSEQLKSAWNTNTGFNARPLRQTAFCPSNSQCVPISQCPILRDVLNSECVLSSRIGKLGCGYQGSGLVCCPHYSDSNVIPNDRRDNLKCGQSAVQGDGYEGIGAFPWVVRIGFRNSLTGETKYPCTGSIINNKIVLTAAHCALAKANNYKLYTVKVGEWLTNTDIDCGEEFCGLPAKDIPISHVIVHPGYQKETYRHNIALLVLRQNINYTVTAQPICLPETWSSNDNNGILVGWGKSAGQLEAPPRQQTIRVPIVGLQQCTKVYGNTLPLTEDQICAGGEAGRDACSGFGGAPLISRSGDTSYQVGILSFGSDQCGAPGVPSVYVDVRKYTTWINENIPLIYNN